MKCDNCGKPATVHLTEIKGGKQFEKHLCEQCATSAGGIPVKAHTPINELLTNFVMAHSGLQKQTDVTCEHCGITWSEFRQNGLMGCEHDYDVFERSLAPLIQRAHDGATHHVGKVPLRRGGGGDGKPEPAKRSADTARLRQELNKAVEVEDYERAAQLRDQLKAAEL